MASPKVRGPGAFCPLAPHRFFLLEKAANSGCAVRTEFAGGPGGRGFLMPRMMADDRRERRGETAHCDWRTYVNPQEVEDLEDLEKKVSCARRDTSGWLKQIARIRNRCLQRRRYYEMKGRARDV